MLKNKIPAMSQGSLEYLWRACAIKKNKKTLKIIKKIIKKVISQGIKNLKPWLSKQIEHSTM